MKEILIAFIVGKAREQLNKIEELHTFQEAKDEIIAEFRKWLEDSIG